MNIERRVIAEPVKLARIYELKDNADFVLEQARDKMLEPHPRKRAPTFSPSQIADMIGMDRKHFYFKSSQDNTGLPKGTVTGPRQRQFSLAEAQAWIKSADSFIARPDDALGIIIACSNLKGGSTKTTTAFQLAQGLTLRGRSVCLVDLDSQCSLTTLCDRMPERDVRDEETVLPFFLGEQPDLSYAPQATYWDGIKLIPATFSIFEVEVELPIVASENPDFPFWALLERGLAPLRREFDVIILDTPPSLSYMTFNAIYAAQGVVMPLPPETLDFASSAMFWKLFGDLFNVVKKRLEKRGEPPLEKAFDFINVLLSKVNTASTSTQTVRSWISMAYEDLVLPVEIPMSSVSGLKSSEFGSVYDSSKHQLDKRTYARIREACDRVAELVDQQIVTAWDRQTGGQ